MGERGRGRSEGNGSVNGREGEGRGGGNGREGEG